MMTHPKALALALAMMITPVAAQVAAAEQVPATQLISVDFDGGSLRDYVDAIRSVSKTNILLEDGVDEVMVPAVELKRVEVGTALDAVTDIVEDKRSVNVRSHRSKFGATVYTVQVRSRQQTNVATMQGPQRHVQVFSLRSLIEPMPGYPGDEAQVFEAKTILTAIETGLSISGDKHAAVLRYHADSGLLFVEGSINQTSMVHSVLKSMGDDLEMLREAAVHAQHRRTRSASSNAAGATQESKAAGTIK